MILATVNKGTFIYLQSLGKAFASTAISMIREVVFGVGFALLLPRFFGLDGVLYSMPVSDILTFLIAAVVIFKTYKELNAAEETSAPERETLKSDASHEVGTALTNCIITIGRSYGAGGRSIGKQVASMLHIPYYDSVLLEKAAQSSGLSKKFIESLDEKPIDSSMLYRSVGFTSSEYQSVAEVAVKAQREILER